MSTPPKPSFSISAKYLGPVFALDQELTRYAQNMIFARNGTGKSFLSRAFRYLDRHAQNHDTSDAAFSLVSDESPDEKGAFRFSRGANTLGALSLNRSDDSVALELNDTIFHVFSEDFVQEELREREFEMDGKIENQIAVDSENIKLQEAQREAEQAAEAETNALSALQATFENQKTERLVNSAGVKKNLREFKELSLESLIRENENKPAADNLEFAGVLADLDKLKSIPSLPAFPEFVEQIPDLIVDADGVSWSLAKVTSASSVSDLLKAKIDAHEEFYSQGVKIIGDHSSTTCPFCEQNITSPSPKAVIDAYVEYFEAEEQKHKTELRGHYKSYLKFEVLLDQLSAKSDRQKILFDELKEFIPSQKNINLDSVSECLTKLREHVSTAKMVVEQKADTLSEALVIESELFQEDLKNLNILVNTNNEKCELLRNAVEKADDERRLLHRSACSAFATEFLSDHWDTFEEVQKLGIVSKQKRSDADAIEKANPSKDARDRVAETFELLLKSFFGEKYTFQKDDFTLKRGERQMRRGPHRTLSDGEKTAIAFCYFIASIHRKVTANSDYTKLFLVFDDPVTSMSYDFIYSIAQTLKFLSVSDKGGISISPGRIGSNGAFRPNLLILTHSSYFFNLSRTNKVVKDDASFSMFGDAGMHKIARLRDYISPFERQLHHVWDVAKGKDADHSTANAVRSVLEALGRFCRPDKSHSLETFVSFLAGEEDISIKSVMINSLCHGTYYDESPPPDDLKLACMEAISVVEKFAPGQLEIIQAS